MFSNIQQTIFHICNVSKFSVRNYMARRALMYVPGDDNKKLNKAFGLDVDCVAMDCEDGVAINKKHAARENLRIILDAGKPKKTRPFDWGVRVNSIDSGLCEEDLNTLLTAKNLPDTVLLPKVESADDIKWFSERTNKLIKNGTVDLIFYIETATALLNGLEICKAAKEYSKTAKYTPAALVFGSDDFCASIGATRTEDSTEILYARQKTVVLAKAFGLQAIDMVYINFKDLEGLRKQCEQGAFMGFTGKQVIHPGQVPVVQDAFLPNTKQIQWAQGLLTAFEEHQKSGKGAFTYQGSMIDMPTMKQARNIINLMNSIKS